MNVISSVEFRKHTKKYYDLARDQKQVFIKNGDTIFILTPLTAPEVGINYNPEILDIVRQGEQTRLSGRGIAIKNAKDI